MVQSILAGKKPSELPVQSPVGKLAINLSTAGQIGLELPDDLLRQPNVEPMH